MSDHRPSLPVRTKPLLVLASALLVVNIAVQTLSLSAPGQAHAASAPPENVPAFPNNAEFQRRQADALSDIASRLGRIEAKLEKGLSVKVTEMPASGATASNPEPSRGVPLPPRSTSAAPK